MDVSFDRITSFGSFRTKFYKFRKMRAKMLQKRMSLKIFSRNCIILHKFVMIHINWNDFTEICTNQNEFSIILFI